ncbi:MAG: hypothetical protein ABWZ80_03440 [Beijerinckiaceae bacterium]
MFARSHHLSSPHHLADKPVADGHKLEEWIGAWRTAAQAEEHAIQLQGSRVPRVERARRIFEAHYANSTKR